MAASEASKAVALGRADTEACLRLSDEAGWNQTADDWRLFLGHGRTIGVSSEDGTLVASAAALPYERFGFVSMVLVTAAWRRRGLATGLVERCVEALTSRGLVPVLDATPAGALVYGRQGFGGLFELDRWQGEVAAGAPVSNGEIVPAEPGDLETLRALDREANGADRGFLLKNFLARNDVSAFVDADRTGFAIVRRGRRAMQIGPVAAASPKRALALLSAVLGIVKGRVFADIPRRWHNIAEWLSGRGFTRQRSFTRMAHGHSMPFGRPDRLFAAAGPEFG